MKSALRYLICAAAVFLQTFAMSAQFRIRGTVADSTGAPIESAAVLLMDPVSETFLQQGITSADGGFDLPAQGKVRLYVSCLGYQPYEGGPFEAVRDTVLPNIVLTAAGFRIDDVVVVGERQTPSVRMEQGKMIYTPKNSSITAGSTALEVLKKTPGVFVDGENNISVAGKNSVLVILNGKQTYMQKDELVSLLRATPSSSVSSVEVIRDPSARYDAEGSGGIINIVMDRNRSEGFFLSLNNGLSYWDNLRENTELSFSHTKGKFSLSGNYNHAFGHYSMDYGMRRIQGGKEYFSPTDDTEKRRTVAGSLNLEFAVDGKHLLGGRLAVNALFGPGWTATTTEIRDTATQALEQTLYASNDYYMQKGNRYSGNLYYVATPSEGVRYTVDFNYAWFDGGSGNWQPNKYVAPDGTVLQDKLYKSVNSRDINIYALSYDQEHPLWGGSLKTGLKFSSVDAANGFRFYDVAEGVETVDPGQSNDFDYRERIAAAYVLYARSFGEKFSVEAGLRGEYTFSNGILRTVGGKADEINDRDYSNLFPSAGLNYQIAENHSVSLSYSSRIDRPAYQDLNPFEYLLDELSSWKGNPFLSPQKTHQLSLTYSRNRTALTASYSCMKDYKAQITDTVSVSKVIMTPRNLGTQQRASLTLYQGLDIARWWEMSVNLIGYYVRNDIAFDQWRKFDLDGFAGILSVQNTVRLPWRLRMELNGAYYTKRLGASNEYILPSGYVDVGLSRSFADKKWTVSLAMSDIFWTSRWDNYSSFDGFQLWNWGRSETRQVKLNVTYRLGRRKEREHVSRFDEIDRL